MQTRRLLTVLGLLCVTSLLIAACAPSAGGIVIKDPFTRATPAGADTGGAFVTIANNGKDADRFVSASSPAAKTVELHETVDDNGVMKMEPRPEGWEIPAGGTLELKPGGKHIMLIGLTAPLEAGKKIRMTLNFEKAGAKTIDVPVQTLSGM
jgi:periplasmic copper chaperone A